MNRMQTSSTMRSYVEPPSFDLGARPGVLRATVSKADPQHSGADLVVTLRVRESEGSPYGPYGVDLKQGKTTWILPQLDPQDLVALSHSFDCLANDDRTQKV